jgi:hypothetical protein
MNTLYELGTKYQCDKITHHGYHRFYDLFLKDLRDKQITMLEIGIEKGKSLKIWLEYFPKAYIYGIEINIKTEEIGDRYTIIKGDQSNIAFLKQVGTSMPKLDFIIDDGSHVPEHQILSFNYLFENCLQDGGIYIIEDIETSYWKNGMVSIIYNVKSGYRKSNSVIEIFKKVLDNINYEFLNSVDRQIHEKTTPEIPKDVRACIGMITFCYNSIIIKKKDKTWAEYDNRQYRYSQCV